jgi:cell division transport system permease protein
MVNIFHTFGSVLKNGWTNFKRNSYLSVAATGVMSLALILFLSLLSLQFLTAQAIISLEDKVDISAYFKTDTPEEQVLEVRAELQNRSDVASVNYVSREDALADFKARHAQDALISESLSLLDGNPLSASLNIKTKEFSEYATVAQFLQNSRFKDLFEKINFEENKGIIDKISGISNYVRTWGLTATFMLALIAVLVTFNTVRLTIFNQKQEIEIMRLVGASNWHIRGPYLAEGGFYGLFAAVVSLAIFYPVIYFTSDKISNFFETVNLWSYFSQGAAQIFLITAGLGVFMGIFSSFVAIRRHLKI